MSKKAKPKTKADIERRKKQLRDSQARRRDRLREEGRCIIGFAGCEGKAIKGGTTCRSCNQTRLEKERETGWIERPNTKIKARIVTLYRKGKSVSDIIKDRTIARYALADRAWVSDVLRQRGLL